MFSSANEMEAIRSDSRIGTWLGSRTVRLAFLIGVLLFEIGFVWFILHFGWMESVNIWTQLGVISAAALPLLIAGCFLVRKRFSLTSALVAFTMFAVFMGFTMRPVYEARQTRASGKLLVESGARISDSYYTIEFDGDVPRFEYHQVGKKSLSDWMARLVGEYAKYPLENEICSLTLDGNEQMEVFSVVANRLKDVEVLHLGAEASMNCQRHAEAIRDSDASFVSLGSYVKTWHLGVNFDWLASCENVRALGVMNAPNAAEMVIRSDDLALDSLHIWVPPLTAKFPTKEFVDSKAARRLKMLGVHGYQISNAEARHFSKLTNLRSLWLSSNLSSGIDLLHHLPNLTGASLELLAMTEAELESFKIPPNLKELRISVSSALISESAADKFKAEAPDGCVVYVTRQ
jgi:hypothetical protein